MPNPFGGPPVDDVWGAGPYGYVLGPNRLNPKPFDDWLASLPESENVEDWRDPNYKPPDRGRTISQSIGEWPEYKEPRAEKQEKPKYKEPKTPAEWAEFQRTMGPMFEMWSAYGRR